MPKSRWASPVHPSSQTPSRSENTSRADWQPHSASSVRMAMTRVSHSFQPAHPPYMAIISINKTGVAGHITVRDPVEPTSFWVNPFGVAFSQIKASDLIRVSHEGAVIEGGPCKLLNAAAFMIHSAIHAARPDVMCAAHSHSIHGRAFCTLGRPLDIISQDACAFYNVFNPFRSLFVTYSL